MLLLRKDAVLDSILSLYLQHMSLFRKRKEKEATKPFPIRTIEDLKNSVNILFIDDIQFKTVDALKEKDGWRNIQKVRDIDSITQKELAEAHIIFVDVQGVGKKLSFADEGLGLILAIKEHYPEKKVVMYSAESNGKVDAFHPAANIVDGRLRKSASRYEFETTIERLSQDAFCLDNCAKHVKEVLKRELGIDKSEDEVKTIIMRIYGNENNPTVESIKKEFGLNEIGSIASIIQLLLLPIGA